MKYTKKDLVAILEAVEKIKNGNNEAVHDLLDYPEKVIDECLKALSAVSEETIKEKTWAAEAYIILRMNLAIM